MAVDQGRHVVVFLMRAENDEGRFGVTASRRVGGAVVRSRCKRRLRELYRFHRRGLTVSSRHGRQRAEGCVGALGGARAGFPAVLEAESSERGRERAREDGTRRGRQKAMEKRLLLAFVLSAAILLAWSVIFPPPQRPSPHRRRRRRKTPRTPATGSGEAPAPTEIVAKPAPRRAHGTDELLAPASEEDVDLANAVMDVVDDRTAERQSPHIVWPLR